MGCGGSPVLLSHPYCFNFLPSLAFLASSGEPLGAGGAGLQFWKPAAASLLLSQLLEWGQPGVLAVSLLTRELPAWGLQAGP